MFVLQLSSQIFHAFFLTVHLIIDDQMFILENVINIREEKIDKLNLP